METRYATPKDVRGNLVAEHEHLWQLIAALRDAEPAEREAARAALVRYLAVHEAAEQVAMHNAFVDDTTRARIDEERHIAELVARLEQLDVGDEAFLPALDELEDTLRDHARAEEGAELDALSSALTPDQLGEMQRSLLLIREIAEYKASPVAEGSYASMYLAAQNEFTAVGAQLR